MRRTLFMITLLMFVIVACAPEAAATEQPSIIIQRPTTSPTPRKPKPTLTPTPAPPAARPAEKAVIKQLAANLGLQESDISVARSEGIEFRDACLGVSMPDLMCAQVVTPGRIIVLEADGVQYEYHTSENGSRIQPATLALVWKREGGIAGFCDTLTVFLSGEVFATQCRPQADGRMGTFAELLSAEEREQFADWVATFAMTKLDTSDPKGVADRMMVTLQLFGNGTEPPAESDQKVLFEFARGLYQELSK